MWNIEYSAETELAPSAVWQALRALESGETPMASGDLRQLNNKFELGGTITATPVGIDPLESTITELVENEVLAIQANFNGLILLLRHTLTPTNAHGTRIVRRLEITSDGAAERAQIAGPRISADYPEALEEIIHIARTKS